MGDDAIESPSMKSASLPGPRVIPLLGNALQFQPTRVHQVLNDWPLESGSFFKFIQKSSSNRLLWLLILLVAGCAWLPNAEQIKTAVKQGPHEWLIQKDGTLLSTTQAEHYLQGLLQPLQDPEPMRQHLRAEQSVSGLPLVDGNQVRLLIDGPQTYAAMFSAIRKARHHVHLNAYLFSGDGVGERLARLLSEKAQGGIKVRVIYDAIGTLDTPDQFFDKLKSQGVEVAPFNPLNPVKDLLLWRLNHREHAKLLVVDGTTAFTGGINISSVYVQRGGRFSSYVSSYTNPGEVVSTRAWRDTHLQVNGPIVPYLQARFLTTWESLTGKAIENKNEYLQPIKTQGNVAVRMLDSPADNQKLEAYTLYLSAITQARQRLWITQSYFSPNNELLDALEAAALRGVDVRILLPGITDQGLVYHASRSKYGRLLKSGVRLWEFESRILHAKTAVVDGIWSTVGSANMDIRSFIHNNELNVSLLSSDFAAQLEKQFQHDLENAHEITIQEWQARGLGNRVKEFGSRFLDYWL